MSGTFVTKFSLLAISNSVFGTSNNEETNISNQTDVWYQWRGRKMRRNVSVIKLSLLETIRTHKLYINFYISRLFDEHSFWYVPT